MEKKNVFKWKRFQPVRWYLRYNLHFRDLVEIIKERGVSISHTTIMRWVHPYGLKLEKQIRRLFKQASDS